MKKITTIVALLIVLPVMLANVCFAVNLDDPAQKQVTVKTEIQRGYDVVANANNQAIKTGGSLDDLVSASLSANKQVNTDTEAFKLGVYFKTWQIYSQKVKADTMLFNNMGDPAVDKDWELRKQGKIYFNEYRMIQTSLALDDKVICDVVGIKYEDIKFVLESWDLVK